LVTFLKNLLRFYACLFHALFVAIAGGMAVMLAASGPQTLNFYLLPWQGRALIYGLIAMALVGALVLLLAVRGKAQMLFLVWSLLLLVLVVRYFFFTQFGFTPGTGEFKFALCFVVAAMVAVLGAGMSSARDYR